MSIRVFIVDDHAVVRDGLRRIFEAVPNMVVAGAAGSAEDLFPYVPEAKWDVLVLDLSGVGSGIEVIERLVSKSARAHVVVYSMYPEEHYGVRALRAGAMSYIGKNRPVDALVDAVQRAAQGLRTITDVIASRLIDVREQEEALTNRELEILHHLVEGHQTNDIAAILEISPSTVSTHLRNMKRRLGVSSVTELVGYAFRSGLVE